MTFTADGAALLWYVKNRQFFEMGLDRRGDVLPVSYDALTRDPVVASRTLCRFLGLAWTVRVCAHIDRRAERHGSAVPLDPELRARCDALHAELEAARAAAADRL